MVKEKSEKSVEEMAGKIAMDYPQKHGFKQGNPQAPVNQKKKSKKKKKKTWKTSVIFHSPEKLD